VVLEGLARESRIHSLRQQSFAEPDRVASGPRQPAVREHNVDGARVVEEMADGVGQPRQIAQDPDVKNPGVEVCAEGGGILGVSAEIVVVCLGQRWDDVPPREIERAAHAGGPNERQLAVRDVRRSTDEAVAVKPSAVDERVGRGVDRADVGQS
jgi:hypothetical protein